MRNDLLVRFLNEHPMAILPSKLAQIEAFLEYRLAGGPAVQYQARRPDPGVVIVATNADARTVTSRAAAPGGYTQAGAIAILPVFGSLLPRTDEMSEMSGATSLARVGARFRQLIEDPAVGSIVLDVDSPGGSVFGTQEFAEEVYRARDRKRIVAIADHLAASAAYWIASAATEFHVSPSGQVGSIGVVAMHVDYSKALDAEGIKVTYIHAGEHKVEGNPYEPLEDEAQAFMQKMVDEYYSAFVGAVARNRGVPRSTVIKDFGQGRCYGAWEGKQRGMVDKVSTLQDTIRGLQSPQRAKSVSASAKVDPSLARAQRIRAEAEIAIAELQLR